MIRGDSLARERPDDPIASIPRSGRAADGYEDSSYWDLANGVNKTCRWLMANVKIHKGSVLAYMGPTDLRYTLLLLAALKLEAAMFFPSPHNAELAQRELLALTRSSCFLFAPPFEEQVAPHMQYREVPSLHDLLSKEQARHVEYRHSMADKRREPFVILHTSGTTGTPKPLILRHGYYIHEDLNQCEVFSDNMTSVPFKPGRRLLTLMSMWHVGGVFYSLLKPILNGVVAVSPPAGLPITASLIHSCMAHASTPIDIAQAAPSLLAEMVTEQSYHSDLASLRCIITGSGPMQEDVGDRPLQLNPNVYNYFGLTETDLLPQKLVEPKDWQYQHFHPFSGVTFKSLSDGLYELVIAKIDIEGAPAQPCFEVCPQSDVFHSKDVFAPHETKPDLWRWVCRLDDFITFSTGEKLVPTIIEEEMLLVPHVKGAVVFGQGRLRPFLVVEWDGPSIDHQAVIEAIWPRIQKANQLAPIYGRVAKDLVMITSIPLLRTPKKTVRRRATEELLAAQLEDLYLRASFVEIIPVAVVSETTVLDLVWHALEKVAGDVYATAGRHYELDIFQQGHLDSLRLVQMVQIINASLRASPMVSSEVKITPGLLYADRTIIAIARAIYRHVLVSKGSSSCAVKADGQAGVHSMLRDLVSKHTNNLPASNPLSRPPRHGMRCALFVGSTGSLGPHLLHQLIKLDDVERIDCIDRSDHARRDYLQAFPLDQKLLDGKTRFHAAKDAASHSMFGLDSQVYQILHASVTTILYNAWPVNFPMPLETHGDATGRDFEHHLPKLNSMIRFLLGTTTSPDCLRVELVVGDQDIMHSSPGSCHW